MRLDPFLRPALIAVAVPGANGRVLLSADGGLGKFGYCLSAGRATIVAVGIHFRGSRTARRPAVYWRHMRNQKRRFGQPFASEIFGAKNLGDYGSALTIDQKFTVTFFR